MATENGAFIPPAHNLDPPKDGVKTAQMSTSAGSSRTASNGNIDDKPSPLSRKVLTATENRARLSVGSWMERHSLYELSR